MEEYTGNKEIYIKCRKFLTEAGYSVSDAIHIGNDRYEFDTYAKLKHEIGINKTHMILAWVENGEVKYKVKETGVICVD